MSLIAKIKQISQTYYYYTDWHLDFFIDEISFYPYVIRYEHICALFNTNLLIQTYE